MVDTAEPKYFLRLHRRLDALLLTRLKRTHGPNSIRVKS